MRQSTLALTTLLTAMFTLNSVASANEQTDKQFIVNRHQLIMKAAVQDAHYDVNEHFNGTLLTNSDTVLASKLIKTNPSNNPHNQQNNQLPDTQLNKQVINSNDLTSLLTGVWVASVTEQNVSQQIVWTIRPNGTSSIYFVYPNGATSPLINSNWSAVGSALSGITITETTPPSNIAVGAIEFIDPDHFVLTIQYSFGSGASLNGSQRYYHRVR